MLYILRVLNVVTVSEYALDSSALYPPYSTVWVP